ncbi:hypothetical protein Tco_0217232 [Tanacetum coccineum]
MDGGDDGDDDDGDSSRDDANDEDEDEDEEDEEEHLAPADSAIVVPIDEPVFPPERTEPVIPPPSTNITIGARITVQPRTSISLPPKAEVERLLAMTTPSPSPPISLSPPSVGECLTRCTAPPAHSSPPPIPSQLLPSSGCPTQNQTLRIASTQALVDAESFLVPEIASMIVGEVNTRVIELAELHEHDTQDLYALLEDAQDSRSRISQRVDMDSQRVDLLMGDRMTLQKIIWMVEEEACASRETWAHSIGLSQVTHQELQTHRDHVYAHGTHIQAHQAQLQLQSTLIQTQHQGRARQLGPDARILDHQDASGDADSHV